MGIIRKELFENGLKLKHFKLQALIRTDTQSVLYRLLRSNLIIGLLVSHLIPEGVNSYKSISLLSIFNICFEKIMYEGLVKYLIFEKYILTAIPNLALGVVMTHNIQF